MNQNKNSEFEPLDESERMDGSFHDLSNNNGGLGANNNTNNPYELHR